MFCLLLLVRLYKDLLPNRYNLRFFRFPSVYIWKLFFINALLIHSAGRFLVQICMLLLGRQQTTGGDEFPDTAHTNSSREQLPVTKKAVGCVGDLMRKEELYE